MFPTINLDPDFFRISIPNGILIAAYLISGQFFHSLFHRFKRTRSAHRFFALAGLLGIAVEFIVIRPTSIPCEHIAIYAAGAVVGLAIHLYERFKQA